jgi:hypothetical protein
MDRKEHLLQEQEAPVKNTDNAFVQVSEDGTPAISSEGEMEQTDEQVDEGND